MKSKKIYSIACLLALTLASLTSCDDWLEATSSSQVSDKKLFSTRSGFHEALSGVYLAMATNKTYGAYYTWEINDVICVPYTTMSSKVMRSFQLGAFSTAEATPFVEDMWRGGYHIIASKG